MGPSIDFYLRVFLTNTKIEQCYHYYLPSFQSFARSASQDMINARMTTKTDIYVATTSRQSSWDALYLNKVMRVLPRTMSCSSRRCFTPTLTVFRPSSSIIERSARSFVTQKAQLLYPAKIHQHDIRRLLEW